MQTIWTQFDMTIVLILLERPPVTHSVLATVACTDAKQHDHVAASPATKYFQAESKVTKSSGYAQVALVSCIGRDTSPASGLQRHSSSL